MTRINYCANAERTTRKPRLLLRLLGLLLLRLETDALLALLYQEPPRLTRFEPDVVFPLYSLSLFIFLGFNLKIP